MDYNLFLYLIKVYVKGHSREKRDGYSWACFISTQLARPLSKRARKIQRKMRKTHPVYRGFKLA